ncbi:MAG TPA: penicillin-binding protein 1B, partial [Desulfobulbaceae bacterium]|nr:penicillin-binding protein 1B [Desulfobulbaceae bacterium]
MPAAVYARPLELYPGLQLSPEALEEELQLAGYRHEDKENSAGSYARKGQTIRLVTREFHFLSGFEPSRHVGVSFANGEVASVTDLENG